MDTGSVAVDSVDTGCRLCSHLIERSERLELSLIAVCGQRGHRFSLLFINFVENREPGCRKRDLLR